MPNYPDIRQGTRFSDTSARQWQSAFQSLEGVAGMTVGPGLAVIRSGDAIEIRLDSELERLLLPSITVVVTEKPAEGDKALTVRRVIYGPSVPVAGEYQWADETTFVVFPEVGLMPADFAGLVWAPTENDEPIDPLPPPDTTATFLRARRRGEFWFVEIPGGAGTEHRQFKLVSHEDDHLVCRTWDSETETEGEDDVEVQKRWLLQRTPFDGQSRGNISYVYSSPSQRVGTRGTQTETQVIVTSYQTGDVIYASRPIRGIDAETWLADTDGRAWAQQAK